jgi:hypothetical protein
MIEAEFLQELGQFPDSNRFELNLKLPENHVMCYANNQPVTKFMTKDGRRPSNIYSYQLREHVFSPRFGNTVQ